ncbi:MAG: metal ABC transporter permease [Deltaproteobacteria bacterium]|nr:metal ABC transporter permease [Deltaproteobacteria bacterium]MBW2017986.1 metal ABC transporter permease [Deltaproteobacteria bacterium]MBW2130764.1 metal ABC transporter permease [Deltaproteobacteria bacterium]MBW2302612.1 metal ABC transporter permease [Deltaproteobacteria bacterium]
MGEFLSDLESQAFLQYALLTGLLASIACGMIGSYVVTRRITYIAGAIAHSVLGGMGAARYFETVCGWQWLNPIHGAVGAALLSAVIIGMVSLNARQREDTVIGAVWAIGMAVGVLFIFKTPGYNEDLMSYLFGNILMVSVDDLWLIAGLDVFILLVGILFYNPLLAVCFDEEFARIRGIRVEFYYILLLCMTALTVVLLVTVVGIVMVIALLTLPAAIAGHFSKRLWQMMVLSIFFSASFTTLGIMVSYGPDLPSGATIIALAGAVYLAVAVGDRVIHRWRRS